MAGKDTITGGKTSRKRRAHRKSRQGCRNCKLRRVKCDETRPQCQSCSSNGILCNYDPNAPDLQMSVQGEQSWKLEKKATGALAAPFHPAIICTDGTSSFELDMQCIDRLHHFRTCTVYTLGSAVMVGLYESEIMRMAFSSPFLMHALIALTATHDHYLHPSPLFPTLPSRSQHHRSQSAALFARKLFQPITPQDRDPLWATAALMGVIAFSAVEALTPEESWPLTSLSSSDLDWLRLSEGKMAVWTLTDPLRPGSMFRVLSDEYAQIFAPVPSSGIDGVPPALVELCNLNVESTAETNIFFVPVHTLSQIRRLPAKEVSVARVLTFFRHMHGNFKALLSAKDPVALLLLALWYERARGAMWWMEQRANMEGEAICKYLQRWHGGKVRVIGLLPQAWHCGLRCK